MQKKIDREALEKFKATAKKQGVELTDEQVDAIAGGWDESGDPSIDLGDKFHIIRPGEYPNIANECPNCGLRGVMQASYILDTIPMYGCTACGHVYVEVEPFPGR